MVNLKNISVTFKVKGREIQAVRDVDLQIHKGEIFGIVGTSGAGKSTLLRTINLLEKPTNGSVFIKGTDITGFKDKDLREVRQGIGMIFQHFNLIHTKTVYDNIAFPMKVSGKSRKEIAERVPELLNLVGLSDKIHAYPSKLSGGQKQRVGIARAVANRPEILLCDEPTSALDLETTKSILDLIKRINEELGITVILISHEMDVIKTVCTRVAVMSSGQVVELNPAYEIFADPANPVTRDFVGYSLNLEIPEKILKKIKGPVIKIKYSGEAALKPVLSDAVRIFKTKINILHGKIEYIDGKPIGILIITVSGKKSEINNIINFFSKNKLDVEVLHG